jgi:2-oxoglutarate dehydrogenase E1 component
MQVVNCTTPAQYFHVLRRQMYGGADRRGVRKPLIIFTPKRMLRYPKAVSHVDEFTAGAFRQVLPDTAKITTAQVRRVVLCTGQFYYDLLAAREERNRNDVAIVRVEQLYPFPSDEIQTELSRYPAGVELIWAQEEPRNMGAWRFVEENLQRQVRYVGRPESASPAAGSLKRHQQEQADIVEEAFGGEPKRRPQRRRR